MKVTFNDAVGGDFTTKLIYFTALKQHALAQAEEALREEYTRHVADILDSANNLKGTPNFKVEIE